MQATTERFVIAGVGNGKRDKGQAVEMSPLEKVPVAVNLAAANHDPNFSIWVKDLKMGPMRFSPKGDLLGQGKFQHNDYVAEGEGMFTYLRKTDQTLLEPKKRSFKIKFCDCINRYGSPDLHIEEFELLAS